VPANQTGLAPTMAVKTISLQSGTAGNDWRTISQPNWVDTFVYNWDGQGGTDTLSFNRLPKSQFTIVKGGEEVWVDSVSTASHDISVKAKNLEKLEFNWGTEVVDLTTYFGVPANSPPAGADKTLTTSEDTPYAMSAGDFGFSDSNPGDQLGAVRIDTLPAPQAGVLRLGSTLVAAGQVIEAKVLGTLRLEPAANANGVELGSFTFSVRDNALFDAEPNTIRFNVTAVNDPPISNALSIAANEDMAQSGTLTASDIDSPQLTYAKASNPTNGTVTVNPNGTFTYTPTLNFNGTDSFTFKANDGSLDSAVATVTITVNAVNDPATGSLLITGTPGQGLTLQANLASFSDPDSPPPPNQSIRYEWRADNTVIANVTGSDLFLTPALTGKSITVRAHFRDGLGTDESITSSPAGPVIPASIAGEVRYWHDSKPVAAAEIRVVDPDATITSRATIAEVNSDAQGRWSIPQLDFDSYALMASKVPTTTDHASVTAADVLSALKLSVGRNPNPDPDGPGNRIAPAISPFQVLASEVTGDGVVRSDDALQIMHAALEPEASPITRWTFIAEGQNLSGVSRHAASVDPAPTVSIVNSTTSNWIGVLLGDVDGSWYPGGAA